MKKKIYIAAAIVAVLAAGTSSISCFGQSQAELDRVTGPGVALEQTGTQEAGVETVGEEQEEPKMSPVQEGQIVPENLEAAEEADQMIVAVGTGGCNADVYYYQKDQEEQWNLVWKEAGIVGRNGVTAEKAEGDGKTPCGTYSFTMAFGLKDDPGSILPYHKIQAGDFWVDDPESAYYNQLVNTSQTAADWDSAENLPACEPYYNYALALNYNPDCIPGKGSAIFLHCYTASPDNGSAGCIRLPEERMKELLRTVTEKSRIVIAADLESLR